MIFLMCSDGVHLLLLLPVHPFAGLVGAFSLIITVLIFYSALQSIDGVW
jgi:hypothetical protein